MSQKFNDLYRIPKININLPTQGKFYSEDFIKLSMDGSLPIKAMTAKDELMLKSPDALLNGDCLVHIIESCVPNIKDVKKLSAPDIEAILLGIFYASYGPKMDFSPTCPVCNHVNNFEIEIREILDNTPPIKTPVTVDLDLGIIEDVQNTFSVYIKPYTFDTNTRQQLLLFEHSKMLQILTNDNTSDEEKLKFFNESFEKMVMTKFNNLVDCIIKIEIRKIINNEIQVEIIENTKDITDFVFNADNNLVEPILNAVDELNKQGVNTVFNAQCSGIVENKQEKTTCGHLWETKIEFNPVSFFAKGFNRSARLK